MITTLLIVGTFILGWIPAVIWFIVFCKDCILPFESIQLSVTLAIGITVNTLIVLKSFLDPIIYTARMKDFQVSFHRMRCQLASKCYWRGQPQRAGEDDATMVHFNRGVLLANNPSFHSTVFNQRSQRMAMPKATPQLQSRDAAAKPIEQTTVLVTVNEGDNHPLD